MKKDYFETRLLLDSDDKDSATALDLWSLG